MPDEAQVVWRNKAERSEREPKHDNANHHIDRQQAGRDDVEAINGLSAASPGHELH